MGIFRSLTYGCGRLLFPALLVVGLCLSPKAQAVFKVKHYTTQDGLSHRWVYHITQDVRGFIWLATYDGLNRYDGNEFVVYRPSEHGNYPATADRVQMVVERSDGRFLVSTEYGPFQFDPLTERFDTIASEHPPTGKMLILPEKEGAPFVMVNATSWSHPGIALHLYRQEKTGKLTKVATIRPPAAVGRYPVQCRGNAVWFWDFAGSYHRYDLANDRWTTFSVPGLPTVPVDAAGRLWLPDDGKPSPHPLPKLEAQPDWTTFTIEAGQVWLYSQSGRTIYRYDLDDGTLEAAITDLPLSDLGKSPLYWPGLPNHFVDKDGVLWFGYFQGVRKIERTRGLFRHYLTAPFAAGELPPVGVSARQMIEDAAGNIFLRDNFHGLYKIDPGAGTARKFQLPVPADRADPVGTQQVAAFCTDSDGGIWIRTFAGLIKYDTSGRYRYYHPFRDKTVENGYSLFDDAAGRLWLPAGDELYIFDKQSGTVRRFPQPLGYGLTYGVLPAGQPNLWGFTDTGLVRINTTNESIQYIGLYDHPRDQRGLVAHRGRLWLATSKGLVKVDPETFAHTTFDRSYGLAGNFVYSIIADGDYLWLGTSDGLCRFDVRTEEVTNFYLEDGLSHYEFNSLSVLKTRDGQLFMGTLNGVNAFFPAELSRKTAAPARIHLSKFSYYDAGKDSLLFLRFERLNDDAPLVLPPSVKHFTFYLALDNYVEPEKNKYAWQLEGIDGDWNYVGSQSFAVYNQLPPGHYTFRAKAADPFGNWSVNELVIPIKILRPWYSRWWAWLLYGSIVVGVVYLFFRFQLRRRLEQAENRRLRELDDFKSRFFANITHEFRTPLTVILGTTEQLMTGDGGAVSPPRGDGRGASVAGEQGKLKLIKRNGENLLRLINQILDLAKLESRALKMNYVRGDVLAYLRYVVESLHSLANTQNVLLRLESPEVALVMDYDPERLLYVVHNLLSNAIKFTPSGGRITLRLTVDGPSAVITVSDTGVGIDPADLPRVFDRFFQANNQPRVQTGGSGIGLSLTRELVQAMGGNIAVASELGKGTTFTVRLPIKTVDGLEVGRRKGEGGKGKSSSIEGSVSPPRGDGRGASVDGFEGGRGKAEGGRGVLEKESLTPLTADSPTNDSPLATRDSALTTRASLLIIEDNPDVVEYLAASLRETYLLSFAYNGRAGIEQAFELVPDIIISDVMMPEKDGFEVCDTLKNDERSSHIPIVLLTAKADVDNRIAGLRRGADAYLAKPFHPEELRVTLEKLLENQRRLQERYSRLAMEPAASPAAGEPEDDFVIRLQTYYEHHLADAALTLDDVCRAMGMSRTNLNRKLQALTDQSAMQLLRRMRLRKARHLLQTTELTVAEIAFDVGFNDPKYFSRAFSEEFGRPPSEIRSGG